MLHTSQKIIILISIFLILGCSPSDQYDINKMDLKPTPAIVSSERHKGEFSTGDSLSFTSELKPLVNNPLKIVRLDTTHKIIEVAPGVKFGAWTFGNQVPGPTIRARVGDKIRFSMTNRSDEVVPGLELSSAPMMHSIDFHAAMVSPQDKYRSLAPGQTIEFEFTLNYPGVFMYHCGTPMILEHIASGMYGAIIVEPKNGYPTKVDREYVVIQSEFYLKPDPLGKKIDGRPLYVLDTENLKKAISSHTVFNGQLNGMVKEPLKSKPGERVRLFVLNVGPSKTSSFHVVGTIFDRVWMDGNPDNQLRGMQTVLLGASSAAIVEMMIPEHGKYLMLDHQFADASQGAIGVIATSSEKLDTPEPIEHNNMAASDLPEDQSVIRGKNDFESKCLACHSIGQGKRLGPDLAGVTKRHPDEWIARWLTSPEAMLAKDPTAIALLKEYNNIPMPNQNLQSTEIKQYIQYFHWADSKTLGVVNKGSK